MKTTKLFLALISSISILMTSCSKEEALDKNSVFVDSEIEMNALDKYIEREYRKPYNIQITYKYVDIESDLRYNLSPAEYESSIRMVKLIKYLAIEPYDDVTGGTEFIRTYFPKVLNFIGSNAYNNNGTRILGTAEGGRKITMFNLNSLNATTGVNATFLRNEFFHTIHHEFAHILHQTKPYTPAFNQISGTKYTADEWNVAYNSTTAVAAGFITPYASKAADEDFVEIIAHYITFTPAQWNTRINLGGNAGRDIILQKFEIIRTYLQESWNIDIDAVRDNYLERQANLANFDQLNID